MSVAQIILDQIVGSESDLRSLISLSSGSYSKAYNVAKSTAARYNTELTLSDFDYMCSCHNDGCEVEWSQQ